MRKLITVAFPALAVSVLVAACGSSSSSSTTKPPASSTTATAATVVKTASNAKLGGTVLVDARGMTLYRLSGEGAAKFICTGGSCTRIWHPLRVSSGAAPSGTVGSLGTVKRPDGTRQVTFRAMPLYTFAQDRKPGDANGQGIKDVGTWSAVSPAGTTGGGASTTAPAQTTQGGTGY